MASFKEVRSSTLKLMLNIITSFHGDMQAEVRIGGPLSES